MNVAELLMILGFASVYYRKRYQGLLTNRKFYKKRFEQKYNEIQRTVIKDIEKEQKDLGGKWRRERSMLPMHPNMKRDPSLPVEKGAPGEVSPNKRMQIPRIF